MFSTANRKSAVELLQESKAFYVKSEIVLDRKQVLRHSKHLQVKTPIIYSSTLSLKKSPSSDHWLQNSAENEFGVHNVDFYTLPKKRSDTSIKKEITSAQPLVKPELSPSEEERLLVEQLLRSQESGQTCKRCTCHVVFSKSTRQKSQIENNYVQVKHSSKSPKKDTQVAKHQRSESVASRNQLQIKLRRLLWDDEYDDSSLRGFPSQQHKSLPDLRSADDGVVYDTLTSPGRSLRDEDDDDDANDRPKEKHSVSPALTMPECTWTFFEGEPITLSAPPEFMDTEIPDTIEPIPEKTFTETQNVRTKDIPLDMSTSTLLERFFKQMGLQADALSISGGSSPVFFESIGSADTPRSSSGTDPQRIATETSVVERNARIIKWLCNCRKAGLRAALTPS